MNKRLAILLCIAMVLSLLPVVALPQTASAAPATTINIAGNSDAGSKSGNGRIDGTYEFDATTGTLTLDGFKDSRDITWTDGELNIVVEGECSGRQIVCMGPSAGLLTISGAGKLTLSHTSFTIRLEQGLVIDEATVIATTATDDYCLLISDGITVKNGGSLTASSADEICIRINRGDLTVQSGGYVEGISDGDTGISVNASGNPPYDGGNIIVDGGTVKGSGGGGIEANLGDITLISGSIIGTASGGSPGIYASRQQNTGGKITVNGGTLTGTNTYETDHQYARGIRAEYGLEITGGKVVGENKNPDAAAVFVQGQPLVMTDGELTATNTATAGGGAYGLESDEGITLTGGASKTPQLTASGRLGIVLMTKHISLTKANVKATGVFVGIGANQMKIVDSTIVAEATEGTAIQVNFFDASGSSDIKAKGTENGIYAIDGFKVRGNTTILAEATG
ncbi:hypothetical protein LJC55_00325 [Eubacteriales bacterium OttesenSCG-928-N14]|nr:hypothetical protein [Eubacteriales bacterium OttesenSCG-928-N14]